VPWTIGQFPELNHLDARQRAELVRRLPWWTYSMIICEALVAGGAVGVGMTFGSSATNDVRSAGGLFSRALNRVAMRAIRSA
jgi:hypothetical protein